MLTENYKSVRESKWIYVLVLLHFLLAYKSHGQDVGYECKMSEFGNLADNMVPRMVCHARPSGESIPDILVTGRQSTPGDKQRLEYIVQNDVEMFMRSLMRGAVPDFYNETPLVSNSSQARAEQTPESDQKGSCPVMYSTGEKLYSETDFQDVGEMPLTVARTFRSMSVNYLSENERGIFGHGWASELDMHLRFVYQNDDSCPRMVDVYPNSRCYSSSYLSHINLINAGFQEPFVTSERGSFRPQGNIASPRVIEFKPGSNYHNYTWQYTDESGVKYTFNDAGRLLSKTNIHGISWRFIYEPSTGLDGAGLDLLNGKLKEVVHSSGRKITLGWTKKAVMVIERPIGDDLIYPMFALTSLTLPNGKIIEYQQSAANVVTTGKVLYPEETGEKMYSLNTQHGRIYLNSVSVDGAQITDYGYSGVSKKVDYSGMVNGINRSTYTYTDTETVVTNAKGGVTTYQYDNKKRLTGVDRDASSICPSLASKINYSPEKNSNIEYKEDWNGNRTSYSYYSLTYGRTTVPTEKIKYEFKNGITQEYFWDSYGRLTAKYIWDGAKDKNLCKVGAECPTPRSLPTVVNQYIYDSSSGYRNRIKQVRAKALKYDSEEYTQERIVSYSYQFYANNLPSKIIIDGTQLGDEDIATIEYDSQGRVKKTTNALGHVTNYQYNISTSELNDRVIDPNGLVTDFVYDAKGRLKTATINDGVTKTTTYEYYGDDKLKKIIYPNGDFVSYGLDAARRINSIKKPDELYGGQESVFTYDLLNNVETIKNYYFGQSARNLSTVSQHHEYDEFGNLKKIKGQNGQFVSFSYGVDRNVETAVDALGRTIRFTYDPAGNLESTTIESTNEVTQYRYDAMGYLFEVIDPLNNTTRYHRNGFGDVEELISQDTGTTAYTYDEAGLIDYFIRADGVVVDYAYDLIGRVTSITTTGSTKDETINYYYDVTPAGQTIISCENGIGRLCGMADSSGETRYRYDRFGRLKGEQAEVAGARLITSYQYDQYGRLVETYYPNHTEVKNIYDINNNVKEIQIRLSGGSWKKLVSKANYYNHQRYTYGNGIVTNQHFDLDGRITSIKSSTQDLTYLYKTKTDLIETINNGINTGASLLYTYDGSDRVFSEAALSSSATLGKYFYDKNGNRIKVEQETLPPMIYRSDSASNKLLARYQNSDGFSYEYDEVGRLVSRASSKFDGRGNILSSSSIYQFQYDGLGRLSSMTPPSRKEVIYSYNGLNQRVREYRPAGPWSGTPKDIKSLYDASGRLSWEFSVVASYRNESTFIYLGGQIVGMIRNGQIYYIHNDHLGRPEVITDSNKIVVWQAKNGTFDRIVLKNNFQFSGFHIGFPGQYYDNEAQLWYNWHRYYDASTGRYIQSDPIGLSGGTNTYTYTDSNPVSYIDPLGLHFETLEGAESRALQQALDFASGGTPHISLVYEGGGFAWGANNILSAHTSAEKYEITRATSIMTTTGIGTPTNIGGFTEFTSFGKINTIFIAYGKRNRTDKKSIIAYAKLLSEKTGAKVHWFLGDESGCIDASK